MGGPTETGLRRRVPPGHVVPFAYIQEFGEHKSKHEKFFGSTFQTPHHPLPLMKQQHQQRKSPHRNQNCKSLYCFKGPSGPQKTLKPTLYSKSSTRKDDSTAESKKDSILNRSLEFTFKSHYTLSPQQSTTSYPHKPTLNIKSSACYVNTNTQPTTPARTASKLDKSRPTTPQPSVSPKLLYSTLSEELSRPGLAGRVCCVCVQEFNFLLKQTTNDRNRPWLAPFFRSVRHQKISM